MIKLSLINGHFSSLDGDLNLERLLRDRCDDVVLSCDEPRHKMRGHLERASAEFISGLLPHKYIAKWDESTVGSRLKQNLTKELPAQIDELRLRVVLKEVE